MITLGYKLRNHKKIPNKLGRILTKSDSAVKKGLKDSAEYLDELAMEFLDKKLGTGIWGKKWGHSKDKPIADSKFISEVVDLGGAYEIQLAYTSKHAAVVEFGGLSTSPIPASEYGREYWPIGASNAGNVVVRGRTFRVQQGYHYLQNSLDNINFARGPNSVEGRTGRYLLNIIESESV